MNLHLKPASLYASQGMEDGPAASALITTSLCDNGIAMANFPTNDDTAHETPATPPKVNGDAQPDSPPPPQLEKQVTAPVTNDIEEEESCPPPLHDDDVQSRLEDMITAVTVFEHDEHGDDEGSSSGCDHLVIDEEVKPARRRRKAKVRQAQPPCLSPMVERNNIAKATPTETPGDNIAQVDGDQRVVDDIGLKLAEDYIHTNPYFAESLFELSKHYNTTQPAEGIPKLSLKKIGNRYARKRGKNGTPKLREYAQYLGLQPTVQFKCSKCGSAGFESLQLLNEHLVHCTAVAPMHPPPSPNTNTQHSSTNFKVTRKVFLCSACGTYYENWNLFLHMREVHRRYICLYCLGMFPHADKLAAHLVGKHNCAPPARHADEAQFARAHHREPCLLMCCDCQRVFTEQDCVTRHKCADGGGGEEVVDPAMGAAEKEQHDVQVTTNQLVIETSATRDGELSLTGTVEVANASDALQEGVASDVEGRGQCEDNDAERDSESERENDADVADDSVRSDPEERLHSDAHDSDDQHGDEGHDEESNNSDEKDDHAEQMDIDHPEYPPAEDPRPTDALQDDRKVPKVTLKLPRIYTTSAPEDPQRTHSQDDDPPSEDYSEDDSDKNSDPEEHTQPEANDTSLLEPNSEADVDVDIEGNTSQEEPEVNVGNTNDTSEHPEEVNIEGQEHTEGGNTITEETSEAQQLYVTAGSDIPINEIELDQPLDKFDIKLLLQKCLQATISVCLYCNHARKIAVNGKQLGLHAIAEHRYSSVVKSITAEELIPESFNNRIRESLDELDRMYFTLEVAAATPTDGVSFTHLFECFQCRYSSNVHKELFMHNRKLHAKALLLCTMCKTSFYSYSELLCHLCPGVYSSDRDRDVLYRCCMCVSDDLPSAFRLVVHLRKKHHACDVCLEICHNQMRLSNHVWKHKLHHLCYRCGIAYRNKPDITKHLFWKHGTESVQCKKCLQKKWPHVYHFCQPPATFTCDQCSTNLTSAIKLKVHRRLHTNELPHHCPEEGCEEKFISKRLLAKHDKKTHREPEEVKPEPVEEVTIDVQEEPPEEPKQEEVVEEKEKEVPKPKVDVYDLPELNLSESDSDSEDESSKSTTIFKNDASLLTNTDLILETTQDDILKLPDEIPDEVLSDSRAEASPETTDVVLDIWNNFKTYQENIAKTILSEVSKDDDDFPEILTCIPPVLTLEEALRDHDYCPRTTDVLIEEEPQLEQPVVRQQASPLKTADHDYCSGSSLREPEQEGPPQLGVLPSSRMTLIEEPEVKAVEKVEKVSSDSSSDSDSSSCTCGSNCSCSSGSSSSSSSDSSESDSSSEEGRRRQQVRREKRRGRKPKTQADNMPPGEAQASKLNERLQKDEPKPVSSNPLVKAQVEEKETPIRDSDLSTTESDTDEEFYDKEPQKIANKLLAEKREKLMQLATTGTYINGTLIDSRPTTPSIIPEDANNTESVMVSPEKGKKQKKSKSKKKKKKKAAKREAKLLASPQTPYLPHQHRHHHHQQVAPLTLSLTKCAPMTPVYNSPLNNSNHIPVNNSSSIMAPTPILTDNENSTTRASKRRRVPNKFYGYSSDEENEKVVATGAPNIKFRKVDLPSPKPHLVVPPITIKTTPVVDPISIRVSLNPKEMKVQPLRLPVPKRRRSTAKTKVRRAPRPQPPPPQAYPGTPSPMRSPAALPPPQPTPARMIHTGRKSQPAVTPPPPPPHPILQASRPDEYENDSNSSTSDADEDPPMMPQPLPHAPPHAPPMGAMGKPNAPTAALYCYCKCPYDEVSEMIGCDSDECAIEWFHFECVGIMVPPKGQWFCPDCRKKKQQRREILQQAQVK